MTPLESFHDQFLREDVAQRLARELEEVDRADGRVTEILMRCS